ncbi:MAG: pilin [bacterium]|nr:pilin [bacterium]
MKFRIFFLIVLLISGFFLFFNTSFSTDTGETDLTPPEEEEEPPCEPCYATYYQCTANCDGELQEQTCEECCGGGCSGWTTIETGDPWQKCDASVPGFYCDGSCLETPANPRYYDNPTYSDQSGEDYGNKNIYLPVKLDWNDVEGWGQADGPQSYVMNIDNTRLQSSINEVLDKSNFIPPSCTLKSNSSHNWQVKACCTADGSNCGSESSWGFETNITPELVSPYDPDWVGAKSKEMVPIPSTLDWCDVDKAKSYFLKIDKDGKLYYPFTVDNKNGLKSEITLGPEVITKLNTYDWQIATCLNDDWTKCGVECSSGENGQDCGNYSQTWKITTGLITLPVPEIISPKNNEAVNFYSNLTWEASGVEGISSYRYEIYKGASLTATSSVLSATTSVSFETFWENLEFNQAYSWIIRSCWDEVGADCEEKGGQSAFKTTGAPPTFKENLSEPKNGAVDVLVPTNLNWDDMPGAASYYYEISPLIPEEERAVGASEVLIGYPVLGQGKNYQWQVKTCADREGKFCGEAASQSFTTIRLAAPVNPLPENSGRLPTTKKNVEWGEVLGANFYQYNISQGKVKGISPTNSAFLPTEKLDLGSHTWQVRACIDKDCKEAGNWSSWNFILTQREDCNAGFIPCSRDCDVSETSWNERESCGFKHIFLTFKNILDFLLWRLAPIILVLLALGTGVIFYFSMGAPATIINVKSIWKSAGIGFAVIFLAWNFLNLILNLLGFTIKWWEFPF